jgi:hypothetical protein
VRIKVEIFLLSITTEVVMTIFNILFILIILFITIINNRFSFTRFILFIKSSRKNILIFFLISSYPIILIESNGYIINTKFLLLFNILNYIK